MTRKVNIRNGTEKGTPVKQSNAFSPDNKCLVCVIQESIQAKKTHLFSKDMEWFTVNYLHVFCSDNDEFFRNTKQVLDELGIENYTSDDCKIVKYVCTLVSARAAFLSSAGESM